MYSALYFNTINFLLISYISIMLALYIQQYTYIYMHSKEFLSIQLI